MATYCPRCEKEVSADAAECQHCGADFSSPDGWKPTSEPGTWKPQPTGPGAIIQAIGRLVVGGVAWFAFMLVAMFAGFTGGYSAGKAWIGFAQLLAVEVLVWALLPIFRLFAKK